MAHTPGPWSWDNRGLELFGVVTYPTGTTGTEQVLAIDLPEFIDPENKVLISAAPELLAALQLIWLEASEFAPLEWVEKRADTVNAVISKALRE